MDLLAAFKRKKPTAAPAEPAVAVPLARARARQRLIGAAVLVVVGVIGFPLLFETQPRPIPVDLPIEIPRKDGLPPLAAPFPAAPVATAPEKTPVPTSAAAETIITESQADAGREVPAAVPPPLAAASAPAARAAAAPASAPPRATAAPAPDEAARALALLEGKPTDATAADAAAARYVVQVGAFAEPGPMKDARAKVEGLGMKTYTQVAEPPAGPRTRVRVGPFPTRAEAERAAAKVKAAGLPAVILTL